MNEIGVRAAACTPLQQQGLIRSKHVASGIVWCDEESVICLAAMTGGIVLASIPWQGEGAVAAIVSFRASARTIGASAGYIAVPLSHFVQPRRFTTLTIESHDPIHARRAPR
jgi:hypothetical protein